MKKWVSLTVRKPYLVTKVIEMEVIMMKSIEYNKKLPNDMSKITQLSYLELYSMDITQYVSAGWRT